MAIFSITMFVYQRVMVIENPNQVESVQNIFDNPIVSAATESFLT
jgi:hypothetical protein